MNKKKLLLTLAISMMLGGCKESSGDQSNDQSKNETFENLTDTMLVIGVWNQPNAWRLRAKKDFMLVDKRGNRYRYKVDVYNEEVFLQNVLPYVQRGDTLYIENGRIVKNLTMERMAERYVNGR